MLEPGLALAQRRLGHDASVAAEHRRPVDRRARDAGRGGDRVGHHAGQRALAQVAGHQPAQEGLLGRGRAGEQGRDRLAPRRLRAGPLQRGDAREGGVDLGDAELRRERRRRQLAQRRPADAGAPLAQLAAQEGDAGLDLPRAELAQRSAEQLGLALARAGRADGSGGGGELGEEHATIVLGPDADRQTNR